MNWLKLFFSRRRLYSDLSEEIQAHLEEKINELVASGIPPAQAANAARRAFGNVVLIEQRGREVWRWPFIDNLLADIRYGFRAMRRNLGFTTLAVATIGLGVGANAAVFSFVYAALVRPLPYAHPNELVTLGEYSGLTGEQTGFSASYPDFVDWQQAAGSYRSLAGFQVEALTFSATAGPKPVFAAQVTPGFFSTLGVKPAIGRDFVDDDQQAPPIFPRVAIVSHGFWESEFGADSGVIGRSISLDNRPTAIIGVLPPAFEFGPANSAQIWVPLRLDAQTVTARDFRWLNVIGRLAPGVGRDQARAEMESITSRLASQYPKTNVAFRFYTGTLRERVLGNVQAVLLVLLGAAGFALLIAYANVANLLLTRLTGRRKEFAIRTALGAGDGRVVSQLIIESILLSCAGAAAGLAASVLGVRALVFKIPPGLLRTMPYLGDAGINLSVIAFLLAATFLAVVIFGAMAVLAVCRLRTGRGLNGETPSSAGRHTMRLRSALASAEIAVCLILLVGAGLMFKSLRTLCNQDPGFDPHNLVAFYLSLPLASYPADEKRPFDYPRSTQFEHRLLERLHALEDVEGATATNALPLSGNRAALRFSFEGRPVTREKEAESTIRTVDSGYFTVMKIGLVYGRFFTPWDNHDAPQVAIVNRAFVKRYLSPSENPIGTPLRPMASDGQGSWRIVGVVDDVAEDDLAAPPPDVVYLPVDQLSVFSSYLTYVVRTSQNLGAFLVSVRMIVQELDPQVAPYQPVSLEEMANRSPAIFLRRYTLYVIGSFAATALTLAIIGLYGSTAYLVVQRTEEIGIRMALGAQQGDVLLLVLREGMGAAIAGAGLGIGIALVLTKSLSALLYGVTPHDGFTFASAALLLMLVSMAACLIPCWRAARLDPVAAMRHD